jgi:hypothetical protein
LSHLPPSAALASLATPRATIDLDQSTFALDALILALALRS